MFQKDNNKSQPVSSEDEDDDDDTDEDDEQSPSLRISNIAKLLCSMSKVVNDMIAEKKDHFIDNNVPIQKIVRGSPTNHHVWRVFNAIGPIFQL